MPIAGSEQIPPEAMTSEAGPITSEDLTQAMQSPAALAMAATAGDAKADADLAARWNDLTETEQEEARQAMKFLGVSQTRARRIMLGYGGGKYLRRGIAGALAWNFELCSLEEAQRALVWCRQMYKSKDKTIPIRDKVEIIKAMSNILGNVARLCDSSISAAAKFEQVQPALAQPDKKSVMVGVNVNNFPPVATFTPRANNGIIKGDNADEARDRPL